MSSDDRERTLERVLLIDDLLRGVTRPDRFRAATYAIDDALELWTDHKTREDRADVGLCRLVRRARDAVAGWAAGATPGARISVLLDEIERSSGKIRHRAQSVSSAKWDAMMVGSVVRLLSAAKKELDDPESTAPEDPDAHIGFAVVGAAAVIDDLRAPELRGAGYLVEWFLRLKLLAEDTPAAPRTN